MVPMSIMEVDPEDERTDCDLYHRGGLGRLMGTVDVGLEDERTDCDGYHGCGPRR